MTTSTRTFGKAAMREAKQFFPSAKTYKKYGNPMKQYVNFYDENGKHLGYWTNEFKSKGVLRAY